VKGRSIAEFWRKHRAQVIAFVSSVAITAVVITFRDQLVALKEYGYLGIFLVAVIGNATVLLPVPGLVVVFAGGGVLNPLVVGLVAGLGEPLGELTGYLAGYGGSAVIEDRRNYERFSTWMQRRGFLTIVVLAAIPNPLFDVAGMAAGALHLPVWEFLVACWLGKSIKAVAIAYLGARFFQVIIPWFQR
jgi:uncharacterized membrane protein YdjX (TVP38/TMEM64 family)